MCCHPSIWVERVVLIFFELRCQFIRVFIKGMQVLRLERTKGIGWQTGKKIALGDSLTGEEFASRVDDDLLDYVANSVSDDVENVIE